MTSTAKGEWYSNDNLDAPAVTYSQTCLIEHLPSTMQKLAYFGSSEGIERKDAPIKSLPDVVGSILY